MYADDNCTVNAIGEKYQAPPHLLCNSESTQNKTEYQRYPDNQSNQILIETWIKE